MSNVENDCKHEWEEIFIADEREYIAVICRLCGAKEEAIKPQQEPPDLP